MRIDACSKLIARDPEDAEAYADRGTAYVNKGDLDRALADATKALALDPKLPKAYTARGNVLFANNLDLALAEYNKAIELDPKYPHAYSNRCLLYRRKDQLDRAVTDCTKAIELDPDYAFAYRNRGLAYARRHDFDRAIALEPKIGQVYYPFISRGAAYYHIHQGNAYERKNQPDRAIAEYTRAIEIDPQYGEAYRNRAALYEKNGERAKANADFAKAKALGFER